MAYIVYVRHTPLFHGRTGHLGLTSALPAQLIYMVVGEHKAIPTFALIMLGAIYGLQVIIYVLHRKFEHIGWMLVYICGIPFFSFILPLVSFWQMDDFSWGSTREIVGEQGKRLLVHDEGKFDPASIPLRTWSSFEADLWVRRPFPPHLRPCSC